MLYNSLEYVIFLPIAFLIYWYAGRALKVQNLLLLALSYAFYAFWDWRFLFLLFALSMFNYFAGLGIDASSGNRRRKIWLVTSLVVNIGVLGIFKYFNFFSHGFAHLLSRVGLHGSGFTLDIILPVGISFYIFLMISYIVDIYKRILVPEKYLPYALLAFSFFPIILAGPIQRPSTLLPQIRSARSFNYEQAADGLRQILWGLFVKVAVADNLAPWVNDYFASFNDYAGSTLLIGALFYTIQIYADFSGYSHIAIGTASLMGFRLMKNFDFPYFSVNITQFWKKWHISLTTWFRDYLFLPLSFAISWKIRRERVLLIRTDLFIYIVASLLTWFLTGLWHGAGYTFIIWGMIHGILLIAYHLLQGPRRKLFKRYGISNKSVLISFTEGIVTFFLIVVSWIFFRAESISDAFSYLDRMFSASLFRSPGDLPIKEILITLSFIGFEYIQRKRDHALQIPGIRPLWIRWGLYLGLIAVILFFGGGSQEFIYFQF
ncbi:MAG TPA: MBOAT family O-acyltransferase [Bacteroidales bacterium]|nr:MBOAT family O-acyltransferase [Bacteroidales bacterium]